MIFLNPFSVYSIFNVFSTRESGIVNSNISWKFQGFATLYWTSNPYGTIKALSHRMNLQNFSVSDYFQTARMGLR